MWFFYVKYPPGRWTDRSRVVVSRDWRQGPEEGLLLTTKGLPFGAWKPSGTRWWRSFHDTVTVLNITEVHTLNQIKWWILFYACMLSRFSRAQLFVTTWTATCRLPLSTGILQARILEWAAIPSSRGCSRPRNPTLNPFISCTASGFLTAEPPGKPYVMCIFPHNIKTKQNLPSSPPTGSLFAPWNQTEL